MTLVPCLVLAGCFGPDRPARPDFAEVDDPARRVPAIQFLPADEVAARLDELATVAAVDPSPRVRDQVVLRLQMWGQPPAIPVLNRIYRDDANWDVADAALDALMAVCHHHHGPLPPAAPPPGPIPEPCTPAYDGSRTLPEGRPPPRDDAAAFWAAHQVPVRVLNNGEVRPTDRAKRNAIAARYADNARRTPRTRPQLR